MLKTSVDVDGDGNGRLSMDRVLYYLYSNLNLK
jgi:hypothetical protein